MLIKILGGVDVIAGLLLIFVGGGAELPGNILLFFGMVILAKSFLGFFQDVGSWIDALSGIFLLLSIIFYLPNLVAFILGIILIQKGLVSFI